MPVVNMISVKRLDKVNTYYWVLVLLLVVLMACVMMFRQDLHGVCNTFLTQKLPKVNSKYPRILCAVHTHPDNHDTYAIHVKNTWGKRCNVLLFVTTQSSASLPTLVVNVRNSYDNLWTKSAEAYPLIYQKYFDQADWFFKSDDDAYVIMENLHRLVCGYSTEKPIYFSFNFNLHKTQGHPHGGTGYVLSKEALRRLATQGLAAGNSAVCVKTGFWEDIEAGRCLQALNVTLMDSRDERQRNTFLPLSPHIMAVPNDLIANLNGKLPTKLEDLRVGGKYPVIQGHECCSNRAISFHYVSPQDMYVYEYFLYRLRLH